MHQTPKSLKFAVLLLIIAVRPVRAASGDMLDAIEYYDQKLDHYFLTANAGQVAALDGGRFPGWQRTGLSFKVLDPAPAVSGVLPVCRFYGVKEAQLS